MKTLHMIEASHVLEDFRISDAALRFVVGRNERSRAIIDRYGASAVVDDYACGQIWEGKPVIALESLPAGALVINCSTLQPKSVANRLESKSLRHTDYFAVQTLEPDLPAPAIMRSFREDFGSNFTFYRNFEKQLADDDSKDVYQSIVNFRLTGDTTFLRRFEYRIDQQYFEEFLRLPPASVFFDVGSYDGETTSQFIRHHSDYARVVMFEPDPANAAQIESRFSGNDRANIVRCALASENGTLAFHAGLGSASCATEEGLSKVPARKLDDIALPTPTLIKMDIEGCEFDALVGASNLLKRAKPMVAVAVYHRGHDLRVLFELLMSHLGESKVYLRHYTEGTDETVMFFLPLNRSPS